MQDHITKSDIVGIVVMTRLHLYNQGIPCGPKAIHEHIAASYEGVKYLSERSISRILSRHGLTKQRTGIYADKRSE